MILMNWENIDFDIIRCRFVFPQTINWHSVNNVFYCQSLLKQIEPGKKIVANKKQKRQTNNPYKVKYTAL
jgi:hypothetical protein